MEYVLYFTIYAVIGYILEVVGCSISQKRVVNRGFLFGPVIPIYGFGALLILFANNFFNGDSTTDLLAIFIISLLTCSVLEYFTSFALEKLFHVRWWDYSETNKFNLNGRICLKNSLLFGISGVIIMLYLHPWISRAVLWLDPTVRTILAIILLCLFALDTFISTAAVKRAVKVTDFAKTVGDQTNEIKKQCAKMLGQFIQIWRGADPRILAKRAREEFEKRQHMLAERLRGKRK